MIKPSWLDIYTLAVLFSGILLIALDLPDLGVSTGILLMSYGAGLLIISASKLLIKKKYPGSEKTITEYIALYLTLLISIIYLISTFSNPLSYKWFYALPIIDRLIVATYLLVSLFLFVFVYASNISPGKKKFLIVSAITLMLGGIIFIHISSALQGPAAGPTLFLSS